MQKSECSIPCNLCGSTEVAELSDVDRDNRCLRTVICRKCGLAWSDPRPNADEIKNFYSKDYRIVYKGSYIPKLKHIYRAGKVAKHRYEFIKDIVKSGDVILDVGAGGGEFVFLMRKFGFDAQGIEPNEGYGLYAGEQLELPIKVGFVQQTDLPENVFDFITLHHVLEHLDDPFLILTKLHKALKPNGFLVIEVPNIEGTCYAPRHRFHQAHLYNFNRQTLETMGRKAGFSIHKTEISADGGVITTIFRQDAVKSDLMCEIPGNYEQITRIIQRHTALAHYLKIQTYIRPFNKLKMYFNERMAVGNFKNGKELLEKSFHKP